MARIILDDVHVDFPIYGTQHLSLRHSIFKRATGGLIQGDMNKNDRVVVRALNGINIQLKEGDRLGLIGHNGSGKSTLLKAMAGIYEPTRGRILVEGSVTPLFDMMPGLDVEDSGYENIFTSGMLLGMSRDYIDNKIPEIEEFCELGEYLSLPVRTYSAGMMTRLGFALVTALNPDILLMDEGFGAADLRFADKSAERMDEFIGRSRIMVLASHSDTMMSSICNKVAWFSEGNLIEVGPIGDVFERYHQSVRRSSRKRQAAIQTNESLVSNEKVIVPAFSGENIRAFKLGDRLARTDGSVRFTKFLLCDSHGKERWNYLSGETIVVHAAYEVFRKTENLSVILRLIEEPPTARDSTSENATERVVTDFLEAVRSESIDSGQKGEFRFVLPDVKLRPNSFRLYASLVDARNTVGFDVIDYNIGVPTLIIETNPLEEKRFLAGVVSVEYSFHAE